VAALGAVTHGTAPRAHQARMNAASSHFYTTPAVFVWSTKSLLYKTGSVCMEHQVTSIQSQPCVCMEHQVTSYKDSIFICTTQSLPYSFVLIPGGSAGDLAGGVTHGAAPRAHQARRQHLQHGPGGRKKGRGGTLSVRFFVCVFFSRVVCVFFIPEEGLIPLGLCT
jgi:hypothetical protein